MRNLSTFDMPVCRLQNPNWEWRSNHHPWIPNWRRRKDLQNGKEIIGIFCVKELHIKYSYFFRLPLLPIPLVCPHFLVHLGSYLEGKIWRNKATCFCQKQRVVSSHKYGKNNSWLLHAITIWKVWRVSSSQRFVRC